MTPTVSVIVPTRDRAELARALASVARQTHRPLEVIVVDDGSRKPVRIASEAVRVERLSPSRGAAAARNRGVEMASGEVVAFLDDDDAWSPSYLAAQAAAFAADRELDVATTAHVECDADGRRAVPDLEPLLVYPHPLVHLLAECPLHTLSGVACRRSAFARYGAFDERLEIVHDLAWYLRVARLGGRFVHAPEPLVERAVPGGLVTRHRRWYREEAGVHAATFAVEPTLRRHRRLVRASRELFFARTAWVAGDHRFALARGCSAVAVSPHWAVSIAVRRLARRRRIRVVARRGAGGVVGSEA